MILDRLSLAAVEAAEPEKGYQHRMKGLRVTPTETAATDGHIMVRVLHPPTEGTDFPAVDGVSPERVPDFKGTTIPTDAVRAALKSIKKNEVLPILESVLLDENVNGTGKLANASDLDNVSVSTFRPVEGEYPSYDQAMPKGAPTLTVGLNFKLLERIVKAAKAGGSDGKIRLDFYGGVSGLKGHYASAIKVTPINGDAKSRMTALIMPLRVED